MGLFPTEDTERGWVCALCSADDRGSMITLMVHKSKGFPQKFCSAVGLSVADVHE